MGSRPVDTAFDIRDYDQSRENYAPRSGGNRSGELGIRGCQLMPMKKPE